MDNICFNCRNVWSLPANEPFDDESIASYDRLICHLHEPCVVDENHYCKEFE